MVRCFNITAIAIATFFVSAARGADFGFFGRSGDAIEINLSTLPGISGGSTFSGLSFGATTGHTLLTSDLLTGQPFESSGRFWVIPDPSRNTPALGDANPTARGFQGQLTGSLLVNGVSKSFSVTVQPGYTGSGPGSVGQSLESQGRAANNKLFVVQQQQRLRYLGFVAQGGAPLVVDGDFGPATNSALRTFQGAIIGGVNTTQANTDGIIGPNTAAWLNAANAPVWQEIVPEPAYTVSAVQERFAVSWTMDLISKGTINAKAATGITQRITALSTPDGYGSSQWHQTHRVGLDIDYATHSSTHNDGNGTLSTDESNVIKHAIGMIDAQASGRVIRIITSNVDILNGIAAARPGVALYNDTTGGHRNHLHFDVGPPARAAGRANLVGDFNLDDVVDAGDLAVWKQNYGTVYSGSDFLLWQRRFGASQTPLGAEGVVLGVPEPQSLSLLAWSLVIWQSRKRRFGSGL